MQAKVIKAFSYTKENSKLYKVASDWSGPKSEFERINAVKGGPFLHSEETHEEKSQPEKAEGSPVTPKAEKPKKGRKKKNETT